jgi:class 3 adenylate cyclase
MPKPKFLQLCRRVSAWTSPETGMTGLSAGGGRAVTETRKLAAILVSDIVGYSRLAGSDEDRILARLRTFRSELIDPTIAAHHGRIIKCTGDGTSATWSRRATATRWAMA